MTSSPWPEQLRYVGAERVLHIAFDDGRSFQLPAEYLRVESPSAEVQGHGRAQKVTVGGKRHIGIKDIKGVGNYAVRILFDDGHDTGLYSWEYLYQLGREQSQRWAEYERNLAAARLSRDG